MSAPIRVMIVDDSSVVRKLLTSALGNHPEIEVVGSAANGLIALAKLPQLSPDAVILDVEMPEMDGITACTRIRADYPNLPVIMFSTLTERGASVTFDALAAGASDYVLKPSTQSGDSLDQVVAKSLLPKLIALTRSPMGMAVQAAMATLSPDDKTKPNPFEGSVTSRYVKPAAQPAVLSTQGKGVMSTLPAHVLPSKPLHSLSEALNTATTIRPDSLRNAKITSAQLGRRAVQLVAIAASTGGPNALAEVIPRLPRAMPVPVLIVQHMPPIFTRCLAERLAARAALQVVESVGGEQLLPGTVYIAPGNRHIEVQQEERGIFTVLHDGPPENSCRPSADVLFRSLARVYGGAVLGVILTGMGQDGARGARQIVEAGGRMIVQSGPTCVVWGMPRAVEEAGLAEAVVPLPDMASAILSQLGNGLLSPRASLSEP